MTGRRDELATLRRGLLGSHRLITLTGPGGIGKTWLAQRAAEDVGRAFRDGTYVVELGEQAEGALLAHTVAGRLGLQLTAPNADVDVLVPLLEERHLLLVLDGCERLLPECARFVAGLLRGCPHLHVLATSRQPLGVTGERVVLVPPLAAPDDPSAVDPLAAMAHDAVALFAERASAVLPGFRVTEANVEAVSAVCGRLDGNPLAIELAAARAGLLAPQAILDRLDDRYRLLTKGAGDASPQLRSLRASVEASWDLCTGLERQLWARLSVFPADFELDAVEQVCSGDGIEEPEVLDLVDSLLDKSVLAREPDPRAVRYRMLETLRVYGAERLGPEGWVRWSEQHREWVEQLVLRAGRDWCGPRQTSQLHRLRREHANIVAALERATDAPDRAPQALRMIHALEPWWVVGGRISEGRHWLAAALDHDTGTAEERARALALAAWLATIQGDLGEAAERLDEVARIRDAVTSPRTLSDLARARGGLSLARGEVAAAEASFRESVDLAVRARSEAAGERWLLLGLTRGLAGRGDDAEETLRRALALADRAGDLQLRASAQALQAHDAVGRGEVLRAVGLSREALRRKVEVGDRLAVAFLLEVLAWVALADDDPVRTAVLLGAADGLWRSVGVTPSVLGPCAAGREERLAAARAALGRRQFDRHASRGAALSWDVVIRYAEDDVLAGQRPSSTTDVPLTSRELAVAELVARGMTNREIAAALVISVRTVQGHIEQILRKLGFGSRAQVAAWVAQRGA